MLKRVVLRKRKDEYRFLKEIEELYANGDKEKAEAAVNKKIDQLNKLISSQETCQLECIRKLNSHSVLYRDNILMLRPIITREMAEDYARVRSENSVVPDLGEENRERRISDALTNDSFYCGIYSAEDAGFIGYCGIEQVRSDGVELSIELLREFQHRGYGFRAVKGLVEVLQSEAGLTHFIVRIDPGNTASQRLFKKLGFKPSGITTFLIDDEKSLAEIEEDSLDEIDDDLLALAEEFGVEPRKLLSHLLVYELFL